MIEMDLKSTYKHLIESIKKHNRLNDEPSRNEDIAAMMGKNRTYLSDLLGPRGVVTEDHIRTLKLNFPFLKRLEPGYVEKEKRVEPVPALETADSITLTLIRELMANTTKLINQNDVAVNSIAKLVEMGASQQRMLEHKLAPQPNSPQQSPLGDPSTLTKVLELVTQALTGKHYRTKSEAEAAVRSLFVVNRENKKMSIRKNEGT